MGQAANFWHFKALAAPRPWEVDGHADWVTRLAHIRQGGRNRQGAAITLVAQFVYPMNGLVQLTYASFKGRSMGGQGPCEHRRISIKHSRNLNEGKTKGAKLDDLPSSHHLFGSIRPPARGGAGRLQQSTLFVEPEGFGGYPEALCSLGRVQELDGRVHESPHC